MCTSEWKVKDHQHKLQRVMTAKCAIGVLAPADGCKTPPAHIAMWQWWLYIAMLWWKLDDGGQTNLCTNTLFAHLVVLLQLALCCGSYSGRSGVSMLQLAWKAAVQFWLMNNMVVVVVAMQWLQFNNGCQNSIKT